jgi:cellulase/cellobiase CelA1
MDRVTRSVIVYKLSVDEVAAAVIAYVKVKRGFPSAVSFVYDDGQLAGAEAATTPVEVPSPFGVDTDNRTA